MSAYAIAAVPTLYAGVQFRSRLEANGMTEDFARLALELAERLGTKRLPDDTFDGVRERARSVLASSPSRREGCKVCARCGAGKPPEAFPASTSSRDGRGSYCRACQTEYARERRTRTKKVRLVPIPGHKCCSSCRDEKPLDEFYLARARGKTGRQSFCKDCTKYRQIKRFYGLDREELSRLLDGQGGKCAICENDLRSRPEVDHDHKTGAVRGLLCRSCNSGLGSIERPGFLVAALRYLTAVGGEGNVGDLLARFLEAER